MPRTRILVIDDDPDVRATLPAALVATAPDLDVRAVAGVRVAWETIRAWPPAVVLLDALMPLVEGEPARGPSAGLRFLVERKARAPDLVVIVYSGSDVWREACLRQGAAAYAVKPAEPGALVRAMRRALYVAGR